MVELGGKRNFGIILNMICFDIFLNGEKLCRAGKDDLGVLSGMVVYVKPKPDDDGTTPPLYTSLGGLATRVTGESVHTNWITEQTLNPGDEISFKIVESPTADEPESESVNDPEFEEQQQRKYYQFLKAKYEGKNKDLRISGHEEERIPQLLEVATVWIDEAAELAARLDGERRGEVIRQLGTALGSIIQAKSIIGVEDETIEEFPEPDGPMSPEQQARVDQLTAEEIHDIDEALLANCSHQFRKIAMVVGTAMDAPHHKPGIPDLFYAERIRHLIATGRLESQGISSTRAFPKSHPSFQSAHIISR